MYRDNYINACPVGHVRFPEVDLPGLPHRRSVRYSRHPGVRTGKGRPEVSFITLRNNN